MRHVRVLLAPRRPQAGAEQEPERAGAGSTACVAAQPGLGQALQTGGHQPAGVAVRGQRDPATRLTSAARQAAGCGRARASTAGRRQPRNSPPRLPALSRLQCESHTRCCECELRGPVQPEAIAVRQGDPRRFGHYARRQRSPTETRQGCGRL